MNNTNITNHNNSNTTNNSNSMRDGFLRNASCPGLPLEARLSSPPVGDLGYSLQGGAAGGGRSGWG